MLNAQVGDRVRYFKRKVKTSGQPLSDAKERHEAVVLVKLKADRANAGTISVGDGQDQGWPLTAGEEMDIAVTRLNQIYVKGSTANDTLHVVVTMSTGATTPYVGP